MLCHAGCALRLALSCPPASHQAAYCRRYSPYPRFLSELLLWYMMSLLALFGAPRRAAFARWRGLTAALVPFRPLLLLEARCEPQRAPRQRAQEGAVKSTQHVFLQVATQTSVCLLWSPPHRPRSGASGCGVRCALYADAAASSAPGVLTSRAASVPRASSATASSMMSAPVTACPLRRSGSRPSAAAEMGRKGKERSEGAPAARPEAPPDHGCDAADAAALARPPDHGASAAPGVPAAGVCISRACRNTRCASGLRARSVSGCALCSDSAASHNAPGRERSDACANLVAYGVQLREPLRQVALHLAQASAFGDGRNARLHVHHRAHHAAGLAPHEARDARHLFRPERLFAAPQGRVRASAR